MVLFDGMSKYRIEIPSAGRSLEMIYETNFPHRIDSFVEQWKRKDGKVLETKGVRTHLVMLDYWAKHARKDNPLRAKLGLPTTSTGKEEHPKGAKGK